MKQSDHRNIIYDHYLQKPASVADGGYAPSPISPAFGKALYGDALAGARKDALVLEIGAGEGHLISYIKSQGFSRVYGLELCAAMVDTAARKGLDIRLENALDHLQTLPDASLGMVIAIDVIEHLTKSEVIALLEQSFRCLEPGGVILLQTVNGQGLFPGQVMYGDATHCSIFNPISLGRLMGMAGFETISFRESTCFGPGLRETLRRILWSMIRRIANIARWAEARKKQDLWSENMVAWATKPST